MEDRKKYKKKLNSGLLWNAEKESIVIRKGSIPISDKDLDDDEVDSVQDRYVGIIKTKYRDETKYELWFSAGLLYVNHDKRDPEKSPDIGGKIWFNGTQYQLGGWKDEDKNGSEYTRVKLTKVKEIESKEPF